MKKFSFDYQKYFSDCFIFARLFAVSTFPIIQTGAQYLELGFHGFQSRIQDYVRMSRIHLYGAM